MLGLFCSKLLLVAQYTAGHAAEACFGDSAVLELFLLARGYLNPTPRTTAVPVVWSTFG